MSVSEKFTIDWGTYMSSQYDLVYVKLDVGGAVGEGSRVVNKRNAAIRVHDHVLALRYTILNDSIMKTPS